MDLPRAALTELLDECGCCEGLEAGTPVEVYNRPGLSAIAYRIGTHARFKRSMLARLSSANLPALRDLNTRDDDDFAVALLDGWATVADVLTFYSERIANESYLRTATDRVSLLHLARLIGYELGPGVAAGAHLAFELEDTPEVPGVPRVVSIDKGTKVQSLPGQDEIPQTFETVEKIEARPEWNELRPRQTEARRPGYRHVYTYLKGVTTNLGPGDPILIVGKEREEHTDNEQWEIRRVIEVRPDAEADRTYVRWNEPLGHVSPRVEPPEEGAKVYALRTRAALFGHNAPEWKSLPVTLRVGEKNPKENPSNTFLPGAYAKRKNSWADAKLKPNETEINLEAVYSRVVANGWIVLASPDYAELYRVRSTSEETKADFNITAKTTRVEISGENTDKFSPRETTVYAQSELLEMAEHPLVEPVDGDEIALGQPPPDFGAGRTIIVSGKRTRVVVTDKAGKLSLKSEDGSREVALQPGDLLQAVGPRQEVSETSSSEAPRFVKWHLMDRDGLVGFVTAEEDEIVPKPAAEEDETVGEVAHAEVKSSDHTTIVLGAPLRNSYDRATTVIYANVAYATHGETRQEVLGSGDASTAFLRFTLRESPLTHTSAPTPGGTESSLEVRVDDIRWHEVPDLYGRGPDERVFVTRTDEEGKTTVRFGDGHTGMRLPTGQENVRATYRKGIGTDGLVRAKQLSLLMTPVLGVRSVKNPLAASGADDPETQDEARRNAPLTVLTLDRVVSLRDYEDFARAYAGIAKALATWIWTGETREVFVTVAGPGGRPVGEDLLKNLVGAMRAAGDRRLPLRVEEYQPASFGLVAKIKRDPDHIPERVKAAVEAALQAQFGFEARSFGQGIALSEVVAAIQAEPGVVMADVDELYRISKDGAKAQPQQKQPFLEARAPRPGEENGDVLAAELLTLDPQTLSLEVIG